MAILPKAIYRFNVIPIKLPMRFFTELEQIILKFTGNHKRPRIAKPIPRGEKQSRRQLDPSRQYHKTTVITTVRYWYKSRHTAQWNWTESPKISPHIYGQLIFDTGGKNIVQSLNSVSLCDPMDCSKPGFPVLHHLLEFAQTQVHWVGDAIQPSCPLSSPSLPAFNLPQHQSLFWWVSSLHQVAKILELQLQHQSFQWIFRVGFL